MKTKEQLTELIAKHGYKAYLHANKKHPFFCNKICHENDWDFVADFLKNEIQVRARMDNGSVLAETILEAEMAEVYLAVSKGDYHHARKELMDAFAVLMRMDDMISEMER